MSVEGVGDVLEVVGLVGRPQQQRAWSMLLDAGGELLREEEVVARRHHCVDRGEPRDPVIGVQHVPLPWVVGQHHVGTEPADPTGELAPQVDRGLELTVHSSEHDHLASPQLIGGGTLLGVAGSDELLGGQRRVPGPFGTVGDHQHRDLAAGS